MVSVEVCTSVDFLDFPKEESRKSRNIVNDARMATCESLPS